MATARHEETLPTLVSSTQLNPESIEIQIFPGVDPAVCFVPSSDMATALQFLVLPTLVSSFQVEPESLEVQMLPFPGTAVCWMPSRDTARPFHPLLIQTLTPCALSLPRAASATTTR